MKKIGGMIFAIVFIAVGILILSLSANAAKRCTEPVEGTVIGYIEEIDDEGSHIYFPKVQYNFNGKQYQEMGPSGSSKKGYAEGTRIAIFVNPDNPYDFIIKGDNMLKIVGWIAVAAGAFFLIMDITSLGGGAAAASTTQSFGFFAFIYALIKTKRETGQTVSETLNQAADEIFNQGNINVYTPEDQDGNQDYNYDDYSTN